METPNLNDDKNVIMIDSHLFIEMVAYLHEHALVDKFNQHLKDNELTEFVLDAKLSNSFKKFLLKERCLDEIGKATIQCACRNHGPIYIP